MIVRSGQEPNGAARVGCFLEVTECEESAWKDRGEGKEWGRGETSTAAGKAIREHVMAYRPPDKTVSSFIASTSRLSTIDNQGMSQCFLLECPVGHLNNALLGNGKRRTNKPLLMHTLHSRIVSGTSPTLLLGLQ